MANLHNFTDLCFHYIHSDSRLCIPDWWIGTDFLRVIHCPNSRLVPNDSHEEYGQLAARTSGHYLSGRLCHNDSALLLWPQWQTYCPLVAVESSCVQSAQKGRHLRIGQVIRFDRWWYHILGGTPKTGANGRVSYGDKPNFTLRGTRLRIKAVRDFTWTWT